MGNFQTIARNFSILIFGIVVPIALLLQAYLGLNSLRDSVSSAVIEQSVPDQFVEARSKLQDGNDYALFSMMSAERTNLQVVTNKQIMKIVVMQIGFAVASLGLMFVILGINDGGGEGGFDGAGLKVDFKTGSTGAIVFVVGSLMAAAGGVLKNDYTTVPLPGFVDRGDGAASAGADAANHAISLRIYDKCVQQEKQEAKYECFYRFFEKEFKLEK